MCNQMAGERRPSWWGRYVLNPRDGWAGWHLKRDAPFFYRRSDLGVQGQLELDRSSMVRGPIALV